MKDKVEILRVVVGSKAHGLATPDSDTDFKSVYVTPTSQLLSIGEGKQKATEIIEGNEDNAMYELGHFLNLAVKSNPSILEVFKAPVVSYSGLKPTYSEINPIGKKLQELFPYVWSSKGVYNAFSGYSHDQHKNFFDDRVEFSKRRGKYAVAHLRVLLQGIEFLSIWTLSVNVKDFYLDNGLHIHLPPWAVEWLEEDKGHKDLSAESWITYLREIKTENPPTGNIIDTAQYLKTEFKKAYEENPDHKTNLEMVNEFLLQVRKEYW